MKVAEIMIRGVISLAPDDSMRRAASYAGSDGDLPDIRPLSPWRAATNASYGDGDYPSGKVKVRRGMESGL